MTPINRHLRLIVAVAMMLLAAVAANGRQWAVDDIVNPHLADSTRFVANPDGVLSPATVSRLDSRLRDLQRSTTCEVAVVALSDIDPAYDIDDFATRLFNSWGIGKRDTDNGILILLARDSHAVTIRTGRGAEAVVPDIVAGRIVRNQMIPHFKTDDYDAGVEAGVASVVEILTTPGAADEMLSDYANNRGPASAASGNGSGLADSLFEIYLWGAAIAGAAMLVIVIVRIRRTRRLSDVERYRSLDRLSQTALFMAFLGLALPLPAYLLLRWKLKRLRNHSRNCPHCHTPMTRLNEEADNAYLNPAQDCEERLNSVDYDVWLCPRCHNTEVIPYVNKSSAYTECPQCHARTMCLLNSQTIQNPTEFREGQGIRTYSCRHCGFSRQQRFSIPKIVVMPVVRRRGGGGGFGGGGFGGGSFGGGSSMGGGATGRW